MSRKTFDKIVDWAMIGFSLAFVVWLLLWTAKSRGCLP